MADHVDKRLYGELAARRYQDVVMPPHCVFEEETGSYIVTAWNQRYSISADTETITAVDGPAPSHEYFAVFLMNYLLLPKRTEREGKWLSIHDLKGGVTFFRGPHALPTDRIVKRYENDITSLRQHCFDLGGYPLDMADLAFGFEVTGGVHIALTYWMGDEDFPPEARLMVDGSLQNMPLDVVFALLCDGCARIAGAAQ